MGAVSSTDKATFHDAVAPFLNLSDDGIQALWVRFNNVADNWGLVEEQFVLVTAVLADELEMEAEQLEALSRAAFVAFDTDKNGSVDALEFVASLSLVSGMEAEAKLRFVFGCYDFDDSGALTLDECTLALNSTLNGLSKCAGSVACPDISEVEEATKGAFAAASVAEDSARLPLAAFLGYCATDKGVVAWREFFDDGPDQTTAFEGAAEQPARDADALLRPALLEAANNGDDVFDCGHCGVLPPPPPGPTPEEVAAAEAEAAATAAAEKAEADAKAEAELVCSSGDAHVEAR